VRCGELRRQVRARRDVETLLRRAEEVTAASTKQSSYSRRCIGVARSRARRSAAVSPPDVGPDGVGSMNAATAEDPRHSMSSEV
jgi:hypothetical protein